MILAQKQIWTPVEQKKLTHRFSAFWLRSSVEKIDPDMNPHSYSHLIFDKDAKNK
jgi:hypothetical protein